LIRRLARFGHLNEHLPHQLEDASGL